MFFSGKPIKYLICLLGFLCSLVLIKNAYVQPPPPSVPTYTWSAHGDKSYGVNRTSMAAFGYSIGNCAHCHEQHASVGGSEPAPTGGGARKYLLFAGIGQDQNSRFCYGCHVDQGTPSNQVSMPYQYSYSGIAGGDTTLTQPGACPNDIKDAFVFIIDDCSSAQMKCGSDAGSAHCLSDIQDYLKNKWNFPIKDNVQACSGCHNPHRAQYDSHGNSYPRTAPRLTGQKLVSVVSRPSDHNKDNNAWKLWGDDPDERMSSYTSNYQAPCRYPWSDPCTSFEPDGWNTSDASRTFNTVNFCLDDCHKYSLPSARIATLTDKPPPGSRTTTLIINWDAGGDQHGQKHDPSYGTYPLKAPYTQGQSFNYVLSCLDCHEPHGSPNEFLLRQEVNGRSTIIPPPPPHYGGAYTDFCAACHKVQHGGSGGCRGCHYHGSPNF